MQSPEHCHTTITILHLFSRCHLIKMSFCCWNIPCDMHIICCGMGSNDLPASPVSPFSLFCQVSGGVCFCQTILYIGLILSVYNILHHIFFVNTFCMKLTIFFVFIESFFRNMQKEHWKMPIAPQASWAIDIWEVNTCFCLF